LIKVGKNKKEITQIALRYIAMTFAKKKNKAYMIYVSHNFIPGNKYAVHFNSMEFN
jgi:hypothetical protein